MGAGMAVQVPAVDGSDYVSDGLREFTVWVDRDVANDTFSIGKIEEVTTPKHRYGINAWQVRAKDELDAYKFVQSLFDEKALYDSSEGEDRE